MIPATCLVRMGRGMMMGVDHNRNQAWIGGSSALYHSLGYYRVSWLLPLGQLQVQQWFC